MGQLNLLNLNFGARTHEGAPARNISPELQLRRSVLACLLWESQFYEDGIEIAGRIAELVPKVAAEKVAALAVEGRERMKLRHAPLLLVREMARHKTHRALVSETLARIIQRADELGEFVAIYWKDGRVRRRSGSLINISSPSTTVAGRSSCGMCSSSAMQSRATRRRPTCGRSWSREA
jgi:60 kDa SS-A/Ro ribonucleoprotein